MRMLDGGSFFEGPRWHEGRWWVSDFYRHTVSWVDADGRAEERPGGRGPAVGAGLDARRLAAGGVDEGPAAAAAVARRRRDDARRRPSSAAATSTTWWSTRPAGPTSATSAST